MSAVHVIKPDEVIAARKASMPDEVLEIFNAEIVRKFNGSYAYVIQKDVVDALVAKGHNREEIFRLGWLDVEDIYRAEGWKVFYDKPGYNESYEPSFKFSKA